MFCSYTCKREGCLQFIFTVTDENKEFDISSEMPEQGLEGNWTAYVSTHYTVVNHIADEVFCDFKILGRVREELENPFAFQLMIGIHGTDGKIYFAVMFPCKAEYIAAQYGSHTANETVWKSIVRFPRFKLQQPYSQRHYGRTYFDIVCVFNPNIEAFTRKSLISASTDPDISWSSYKAISDDYRELYDSGRYSDVSICVNEEEIPAHQLILSARSPVFAKMFENEMKENSTIRIRLTDAAVHIVRAFLSYVYSGQIEDMTWEKASDLYSIADKYDVVSLRNICSEYMQSSLAVDTVCNALMLADKHYDNALMFSAKQFILNNLSDIVVTSAWQVCLTQKPNLVSEVFKSKQS